MTTTKSYTDLFQSKTLSKILPLESADMCYLPTHIGDEHHFIASLSPYSMCIKMTDVSSEYCTPCWSLAALLDVLPDNYIDVDDIIKRPSLMKTKDSCYMVIYSAFQYTSLYNNPVDACYEMIIKLNELNLL